MPLHPRSDLPPIVLHWTRQKGCRVERDAPCYLVRPLGLRLPSKVLRRFSAATPHRTVRAGFPHTALRVGLVSSVSLPFAPRLRFTLIPMDAPPYGRAVSDAPPHNGCPQPPRNQTTNPNLNYPSCRIQERFRHNHPTFVILQLRQQPQPNGARWTQERPFKALCRRNAVRFDNNKYLPLLFL